MRSLIFAFLLCFTLTSLAQNSERFEFPFQPVLAADQSEINSDTMELEAKQFQSIFEWTGLKDEIKIKKLELKQKKEAYERSEKLFNKGVITEGQLRSAKSGFHRAQGAVERIKIQLDKKASEGRGIKFHLLSKGNPKQDYRRQVAKALRDIQVHNVKLLEAKEKGFFYFVNFLKYRYENGKALRERDVITQPELENRALEYENGRHALANLKFQIEAAKMALHGAEKTLKRLNN